jgi:hypothetical membrane protein
METIAVHGGPGGWSAPAAYVALIAIAVSCLALATLHVISPEFAPSWRMVSEYANGAHGWLLMVVFFGWAGASFALVVGLWPLTGTLLGKIGLGFLLLAGIGQVMGGVFDINHRLHGPAAMLGIPSLGIAAVTLTVALGRAGPGLAPPLWSAHLPWIAFGLMIGAFMLFFSSLKAAGVDVAAQAGPLAVLPDGVSGYVGWTNRLLFAATYLWAWLTALSVLKAGS